MLNTSHLNIEALSLMTSLGCNLDCAYCHIAQARNEDSPRLQQETIKALQDGTFLQNTKKVLNRLGQSPDQIRIFSFWGQEPTLTLHHITEHFEDWFKTYPNLENIMFSTNSMAYGERIVDFIKKIDETVNHPFCLDLQLSYDGDESTNEIRYADSSIIYNNIAYIINEVNKLNLTHLQVHMRFHGVVSMDLLNRLDNAEKIMKYHKNLYRYSAELSKLNTNKNVEVEAVVGLAIENPLDASSEEGIKLANFVNISKRLSLEYFKDCRAHPVGPIDTFLLQYKRLEQDVLNRPFCKRNNIHNLNELLNRMGHDEAFKKMVYHALNPMLYCGGAYGELKLMYDGTMPGCQNSIYDTNLDFLPTDDSLKTQVKRSLVSHGYYINPITASDEEIQSYLDLFLTCKERSLEFIHKTLLNRMMWMVKLNQIDPSYRDPNKLLEHSFLLAIFNCCSYNNQVTTGSIFLRHNGIIRIFCNGFMDQILTLG